MGPCPNSTVQYFCTSSRLFAPHNIKARGVTKSYSGTGQLCQFPILVPLPLRQVYLSSSSSWPDLHVCSPFSHPRPLTNDFGIDGDGSSSSTPSSSYSGRRLRGFTYLITPHAFILCKGEKRFSSDNTTTTRRRRNEYATDRPANTYNDNCYTGPMCIVHIFHHPLRYAQHGTLPSSSSPSAGKPMLQCSVHVPRVQ